MSASRTALALMLVTLVPSCVEAAAPARAADASSDDDAGDAEAPRALRCERVGDACAPSEACCGAGMLGQLADLDGGCLHAERVLLGCRTASAPGAPCVSSDGLSCWTRPAADGGIEAYYSTSSWLPSELPDFTPCTPGLSQEVVNFDRSTCP